MGEYINKYANSAAIQNAVDGGELIKPYVALDENTGLIDWNTKFIDYANMPLTLKITSDGDIKMFGRADTTYSINGSEFKYLPAASTTTVNVVAGDVIILKNTDTVYGSLFKNSTAGFIVFGNLQYYKTGTTNSCQEMFYGCTGLTDASNLILPATTLASKCYKGMFQGCTSLTTAPELPATNLSGAYYCYQNMFFGCTSLTQAPELPATTLVNFCYNSMFQDCTNLNYIKCLATNISASYCINTWVYNVASSGTFVTPSSTAWSTGYNGIPTNWTRVDA